MKYVLIGLNDDGLSTVTESLEIASSNADSGKPVTLASVAGIIENHRELRPGRYIANDRSGYVDLHVPARGNTFSLVHFDHTMSNGVMHHTDTIDFDVVVEGPVDLLLEDGSVRLDPGDCVCIPGLAHAWVTETVCTLAVVLTDLRAS